MKKILFCLVFYTFFLSACTLKNPENTNSNSNNNSITHSSNNPNDSSNSNNNSVTHSSTNPNNSSNSNNNYLPTPSKTQSKVQLYEGVYFDVKRFGEVQLKNYCEVIISNITETSFDFTVYQVDLDKYEREIIFNTNTAIFIKDGTVAAFYGKDYTLNFTFPDNHESHPVVTDMKISGFAPLEGKTYVNSGIPGHEFG